MQFYFLLVLLPAMVYSAPAQKETPTIHKVFITLANLLSTDDTFTIDDLEYYLDIIYNPFVITFIPVPICELFKDLTPTEKYVIVKTINKIQSGVLVVTPDLPRTLNYMTRELPTFRVRINNLLDWVANVDAPQDVKDKLNLRISEVQEAFSGDRETRANRVAAFIWNMYCGWTEENDEFKDAVTRVSPEARRLLDSRFMVALAKSSKAFADSGYSADIHKLSATAYFGN